MNIKIVLCVSYDGTNFEGFQVQSKARTVQGELELLLSKYFACKIKVHSAGRTDSGVHAIRQYVHFEIEKKYFLQKKIPANKISFVLAKLLPKDISIEFSKEVDGNFHAQYEAISRSYCYYLYETPVMPAALSRVAINVPSHIDWSVFLQYAKQFIGMHDFKNFSVGASYIRQEGKSTLRNVYNVSVVRGCGGAVFFIEGSGFLWKMVRSIVGHILFRIKQDAKGISLPSISYMLSDVKVKEIHKGKVASPQGLYLYDVQYKQDYGFPYRSIPESNI